MWFRTACYFDEVVLFMDCCRDPRPRVFPHPPPWIPLQGNRTVKHFYGFATQWPSKAREKDMDGSGQVHGVFTTALLDGLYNARRNNQGEITGSILANHVFNYMSHAMVGDEYQEPQFDYSTPGDIIFCASPSQALSPIHVSFSIQRSDLEAVLQDGQFHSISKHRDTTVSWELLLAPGIYRIQADTITRIFEVVGDQEVRIHV